MNFFFPLLLCAVLSLSGCRAKSNLWVVETDDVYTTQADRIAEDERRAEIEALPPDSVEALLPPRREKQEIDPGMRQFVNYMAWLALPILTNVLLAVVFL